MFIELDNDCQIRRVGHEPHSRSNGYIGLDRRRQILFIATSLRNIADGIEMYCNEEVGRSSMFDCASHKSKRGYAGSFRFEKCALAALPALVQQHRSRFQRVIICAAVRSAWTLDKLAQDVKETEPVEELEIESD